MESVRRQNEPQNCTRKLVCIYIANKYVIMCASMPVHMHIYIYVHVCAHCIHTSNMFTYANSHTHSTSQLSLQAGSVVSSLTPSSSSWQPPPISCDTSQTMSQQSLDPAEDLSLAKPSLQWDPRGSELSLPPHPCHGLP